MGIVLQLFDRVTHAPVVSSSYTQNSLQSSATCETTIFFFFLALRVLALALAPGAGIKPLAIFHCCDSIAFEGFLTREERRGMQSLPLLSDGIVSGRT